jgi:hypothetical protein
MESEAPAKGSDFSIETSPGSGSTRTISVRLVPELKEIYFKGIVHPQKKGVKSGVNR